jgi:hypothetical protein
MSHRPVRIWGAVRKSLLLRIAAFLLTLTKCLSLNWIQATSAGSGISCAYCIARYVSAAFDPLIFAVHCPSFQLRLFCTALWTAHVTTDTDWGVYSWPWLLFLLKKPSRLFFVTSNRCIRVKNALGWSAVVFCTYGVIQLFSVACVIRDIQKFDFSFVIKKTPNKWRPMGRRPRKWNVLFSDITYITPSLIYKTL